MDNKKTIEQLFAEMRDDMAAFYEQSSAFVIRNRIDRDACRWFDTADARGLTGEEFKKVARNAIHAIIAGDE